MKHSIKYLILTGWLILTSLMHGYAQIRMGAEQTECYFPLIGEKHLLDSLYNIGINITRIFAPEHGFRGEADAGATVKDGRDTRTGIPIASLYGKNKKPKPQQLADTDVVVFDIQDVGARFYTYISTLYYIMQACAENGKELIVLDRPNPCDYVDGPVLKPKYKSFVGMFPIPILHGCTVGEIARMINGEGWLGNGLQCTLKVVSVSGWKHLEARTALSASRKTLSQPAQRPSHCPICLALSF